MKALSQLLGKLADKALAALPGIIGSILSWILNRAKEVAGVRSQFLGGEGVVDGVGGSSERCLKWGGGGWGSLRDLFKNILKQGVGKGKSCS